MTEFVWPNGARMSEVTWGHVSNSESTPAIFTGSMQTVARPGDRLRCSVIVQNSSGAERSLLRALASAMRGRGNRIYLPDLSYRRRGAFPTSELFTNADFAAATGWTAGANTAFSAADGVGRVGVSANIAGAGLNVSQAVTAVQYVPYALRSIYVDGSQSSGLMIGPNLQDGTQSVDAYATSRGYRSLSAVALATAVTAYPAVFSSTSGYTGGAEILVPFTSLSRCLLADGGANLLTFSDDLSNAAYTPTGATIGANAVAAPDGTTTADDIIEAAGVSGHDVQHSAVTVSSAVGEFSLTVDIAQGGRGWAYIQMTELTGTTSLNVFVNLTTGALGTIGTGANWAKGRAYVESLGNNWRRVTLVGRKTNAATQIRTYVGAATADLTASYSGSAGTHAISVWRMTLAQSSSPTRPRATTTTAVVTDSQETAALYVKGGCAVGGGLLLNALVRGDMVEIDKQIKFVTAPLNLDAAGRGTLFLDSPLARTIANDTPIFVHNPMAKFILVDDAEYPTRPGLFSDFRFEFKQDLAA